MSIITFWNDSREQTGQTMATVAVATRMAIERNIKILLISTISPDFTSEYHIFPSSTDNISNPFLKERSSKFIIGFIGFKNGNLYFANT